jgi:hypothetical protein
MFVVHIFVFIFVFVFVDGIPGEFRFVGVDVGCLGEVEAFG